MLHSLKAYWIIAATAVLQALVLRIYECINVWILFSPAKLLISEFLGWGKDVFQISIILLLLFPLYHLFRQRSPAWANYTFWFFSGLFLFLHHVILPYFFYQLRPLDIFLFKHSPEEVMFSIHTSETAYLPAIISLLGSFSLWFLIRYYLRKVIVSKALLRIFLLIIPINAVFYLSAQYWVKLPVTANLYHNKSIYFYYNVCKEIYKQHFGTPISDLCKKFQSSFPQPDYLDPKFPFLHSFSPNFALSRNFNLLKNPPNFIVLIVEGLSDRFIHPVHGIQFMPYLDSLCKQSLYWEHFLSNGERSFAVTPSLLGSLPYGSMGFTMLDLYPAHFSLINILKKNEYRTQFFYGQGAWFHSKEKFYHFNHIDSIIDKSAFDQSLEKVLVGEEKYFWGYNDIDLMHQYFITNDSLQNLPRFDVLFTGTSHAPFALKDQSHFEKRWAQAMNQITDPSIKEYFKIYKKYYISLFNVDEAIRLMHEKLLERDDYKNTIWIITGDHPMTEIPAENELKKYHVPLIINSDLIKSPKVFQEVSSHLDIYESVLSLLQNEYSFKLPKYSSALSRGLDCEASFCQNKEIAFMNDNRQVIDFYADGYYISSENALYKVGEGFTLKEVYDNKTYYPLLRKLQVFKAASEYTCLNNSLIPDTLVDNFLGHKILYSQALNKLQTDLEKLSIIDSLIEAPACKAYIDIQIGFGNELEEFPEIIIELSNDKGEKLFERKCRIPANKEMWQIHMPIGSKMKKSQKLRFKIFVNNPGNLEFWWDKMALKIIADCN